jgi:hypothetical protein
MVLNIQQLDKPQNGKLQLLGSASGQFAKVDYQPILKEKRLLRISL